MQLKRIHAYAEQYTDWLQTRDAARNIYLWESQNNWQAHWDLNAPSLPPVYDQSLRNRQTKRLWKREAYEPKRMMLKFLEIEPEFVRSMFQDLFNEGKSVDGRADRFVFYCDQLLGQYRKKQPLAIDTGHYHDDGYGIISLYLSFQYPDRYAPYEAERLIKLLQLLGATNIPSAGDFPRHCKLMRTLQQLLNKNEVLLQRHALRLNEREHYMEESLLLAHDFACFVVETN